MASMLMHVCSFCMCVHVCCFYYFVLLSDSLASLPVQSPRNTSEHTQCSINFVSFGGDLFPLVLCLAAHNWAGEGGCSESQACGCHPGTPLAGALCLSTVFPARLRLVLQCFALSCLTPYGR